MKIIKITNTDEEFYPLMGPYLANRQIERAVGYTLYDDPGKVWLISRHRGEIKGFCYLWQRSKSHYEIGSCYLGVKEKPGRLLLRFLIRSALALVPAGKVTIAAKKNGKKDILLEEGFDIARETKNFISYAMEVKDEESGL